MSTYIVVNNLYLPVPVIKPKAHIPAEKRKEIKTIMTKRSAQHLSLQMKAI